MFQGKCGRRELYCNKGNKLKAKPFKSPEQNTQPQQETASSPYKRRKRKDGTFKPVKLWVAGANNATVTA